MFVDLWMAYGISGNSIVDAPIEIVKIAAIKIAIDFIFLGFAFFFPFL